MTSIMFFSYDTNKQIPRYLYVTGIVSLRMEKVLPAENVLSLLHDHKFYSIHHVVV